ncbi:hypothetical protein FDJ06_gp331 [Pseudomonas phage SL2]|uniref:Uncharacterized protein n=1 Tax=Pseudomonas phage SL2 TaxID=2041345 RepID=A0A2D1GRF4_9CAUD|nr:hypothetical protein FDJ06_gp331 [Pseudomonas phage SL2]ATN94908.1 hypothetical protein SL2_331 [Pseudomonas phage SL2]
MVYKMISLLNLANPSLIQQLSQSVSNEKDLENLRTSGWLKDDLNNNVFFIYSETSSDILASLRINLTIDPWIDSDSPYQKLDVGQVSRYMTTALACTNNDYEVNVIKTISKLLLSFINNQICSVNNIKFNNSGNETQLSVGLIHNSYTLDINLNIGMKSFIDNKTIIDKYKLFETSLSKAKNEFNFSIVTNDKVNKVASIYKTASTCEYDDAILFNKDSLVSIKPFIDGHSLITTDLIESLIKEIQNKETKKLKLIKVMCSNHYQRTHGDLITIVLCSPVNIWSITIYV